MKRLLSLVAALALGVFLRPLLAPAQDPELAALRKRVAALEATQARRSFGDPATQPPLDSSLTYLRGQSTDTPPGHTQEILSLISEVTAKQAYAWPLYIQLTSAHDKGDAVGATTRIITTGAGWSTGFHTETFHDAGTGTTIGVNVEPHKKVDTGRSIGLNIQAVDWAMTGPTPPLTTIDEAINVQTATQARFRTGLHFDTNSQGERAIGLDGTWRVGLDLGSAPLAFEHGEGVSVRFSKPRQRLEFYDTKSGRTLAYLPTTAKEHAL
jgi:hypothetical protein